MTLGDEPRTLMRTLGILALLAVLLPLVLIGGAWSWVRYRWQEHRLQRAHDEARAEWKAARR